MDVRPSACVPPGVRVKLFEKREGTLGRLVIGSMGRKRIRWSRVWVVIVVVMSVVMASCSLILS